MPKSYRFEPAVIQVKQGTTVTFRNQDNFTHTVQFSGGLNRSLNLEPGGSGSIKFETSGDFSYVCTLHAQQMKGRVIVVAQ